MHNGSMKIAVVTDALSKESFFPLWRRYYGGLFGDSNLFVLGHAGGAVFDDPTLGGFESSLYPFDEARRPGTFADLIDRLLKTYDTVIRVDADEFLVVDPRVADSLPAFLEMTGDAYFTARGFDVVQLPEEAPLKFGPVLAQRKVAYPNSALNKTTITRIPLRWGPGFHWANVSPRFSAVFLLHLKRVDVDWQMQWSRTIAAHPEIAGGLRDYYRTDREQIMEYNRQVAERPLLRGIDAWYRDAHQAKFMSTVRHDPASGLYQGEYDHELVLCELPEEFRAML
jgi:hypothetical protein